MIRRLTALVVLVLLEYVSSTAQTPPQKIVFSRVFPQPEQIGLFIANADGTREQPLEIGRAHV